MVGGTRFDLARWLPAKLDRKLLRDLWASKMQAIAIAFVVAAGVAVHIVAAGMLDSLQETRRAYYDRYRFADVWAPVVRAPERLHADIRDIPGVAAAETRVTSGVLFDIPGMDAPASGQAISLPDTGRPAVNHIHLSEGRLPRRGQREEAVLLDAFARAHGIGVDDTVSVTIHGGRERLRIVGIALSPEHVYAIAPGQIVPDPRLFGVGEVRCVVDVAEGVHVAPADGHAGGVEDESVGHESRGEAPQPTVASAWLCAVLSEEFCQPGENVVRPRE